MLFQPFQGAQVDGRHSGDAQGRAGITQEWPHSTWLAPPALLESHRCLTALRARKSRGRASNRGAPRPAPSGMTPSWWRGPSGALRAYGLGR
jgi:hypothetical protein